VDNFVMIEIAGFGNPNPGAERLSADGNATTT
jgi:hypothetical protein